MANYRKLARKAARRYGVDPNVFARQINVESGYNPNAVSPAGAIGIAQFMPGTARSEGVNPRDPRSALYGAARLDAKLVKQTGSLRKALAAYNAGPGNIPAGLGYADKILAGQMPKMSAPMTRAPRVSAAPASDARTQIALSLIGFGGLGGSYGGTDPLTAALLQANKAQGVPRAAETAPAPTGQMPKGVADFEGHKVAAWIKPYLVSARRQGWKGQITSGYRSLADQTRIYNSGVRPAAKPGTSNHEFTAFPGGAVDVTDAAQLAGILRRLKAPLQWAGAKDPVHFSHPHNGSY